MQSLLAQFGLTSTQSDIFVYLYQFGPKPASSVAKHIGAERTNTYKLIETMMRQGLIAETTIRQVKQFYIADKSVLRHQLDHQKNDLQTRERLLPQIEHELARMDTARVSPLPLMRFFAGKEEFGQVVDDMIHTIDHYGYRLIRCFATNTLESQTSATTLGGYAQPLLSYIADHQIAVELYLGNGVLLLEQMIKTYDTSLLSSLPAGQSSLMIYTIGPIVYICIFASQPAAIKIESRELSEVIGFLFKQVG